MREMSVSDIQGVSIYILEIIDKFCTSNNIDYSLGYGSLIGAIRHKGCIPWDDDIDIIMTRPEYEKFYRLFNESEISKNTYVKLFAPELGNCYFPIARVCDMKRTRVYRFYQWSEEIVGVWIDIFVIDGIGGVGLRNLMPNAMKACVAHVSLSSKFDFYQNIKNAIKRVMWCRYNRKDIINQYLSGINQVDFYSSQKVCNVCSPYKNDIHQRFIFDKYQRVPFQEITVSIISEYDIYLRQIYGDYMKLPPKEKQVRGHSANTYWWL